MGVRTLEVEHEYSDVAIELDDLDNEGNSPTMVNGEWLRPRKKTALRKAHV